MSEPLPRTIEGFVGHSWMAEVELNHLEHMCSFSTCKHVTQPTILEVGSASGATISRVASVNPDSLFISVEPFSEDGDERLGTGSVRRRNWFQNSRSNMKLYQMTFDEFVKLRKTPVEFGGFDIVIVDGSHTREDVLRDLCNASFILRNGGAILAHDYGDKNHSGVQAAVHQFLHQLDGAFKVVSLHHSLIELRKGEIN